MNLINIFLIRYCLVGILLCSALSIHAATADSISVSDSCYRFRYKQLIVPCALIAAGTFGTINGWAKFQNHKIRDELQEGIDRKISVDDFSQYAPMVAVYGLNLCGVKGEHNFRDRTIILATAYAMMGLVVNVTKSVSHVQRPDNSTYNSFPSGHTATAFMGAEFLWHEYHQVSPWIGIAGYAVAAGTGFFRMYNNRHWLNDVIAGAGVGILSMKAAYWLYPAINKLLGHHKKMNHASVVPLITSQQKGICCSFTF